MEKEEYKVDIDVDNAISTFRIDLVGINTQESYKGVFKVKCLLTPYDTIAADKLYRDLIGGKISEAHPHATSLAFALSQLKYRVIKYPPFWKNTQLLGSHIVDHNILMEVINIALYSQQEFLKMKKDEALRIEKELTDKINSGIIEKMPELESEGES